MRGDLFVEQKSLKATSLTLKLLTLAEIETHWKGIAAFVAASYGDMPDRESLMATQFEDIKSGKNQVWGLIVDGPKIVGVLVTRVMASSVLEIVTFWICVQVPKEQWGSVVETLEAFARDNKCSHIQGYTPVLAASNFAREMGFERFYFLRKAV